MSPVTPLLAPCPYCQSTAYMEGGSCGRWWVRCQACRMAGPKGDSQLNVGAAWNKLPRSGQVSAWERILVAVGSPSDSDPSEVALAVEEMANDVTILLAEKEARSEDAARDVDHPRTPTGPRARGLLLGQFLGLRTVIQEARSVLTPLDVDDDRRDADDDHDDLRALLRVMLAMVDRMVTGGAA